MVGDGARGEEGGAEGVGGCGGAVPGVGDPALDGGALVLHPPAQIEGGLGVRHGGVVCLSGVGIRDGMGGAAGWSSRPRSAGWWLVVGLVCRERKILLDGWLAGGWTDFA